MPIRVLLADDSDIMRVAIRRLLAEDARIEIVGEASTFAETVRLIGDCKPQVLLLDLHLPEHSDATAEFVKSQLACVKHILAVSLSNDDEAKTLAESYGAEALLDKISLYDRLIPAIVQSCSKQVDAKIAPTLTEPFKGIPEAA